MHGVIRQHWLVFLTAVVISISLSYWMSVREPVINPDAICYLQSAESMQQGWHAGTHVCDQAKWPFYSALIFAFKKLTHINSLFSAYILNGLFSLMSILIFIAITRFFTDNKIILWLAAFIILFAHEFNSVKQYIIRDHGYWAFYLLSILYLLHYFRKPSWVSALGWSFSLIIATLFRIEGAIFLLFLPFLNFFNSHQGMLARVRGIFQLQFPLLLALIGILLFTHPQQEFRKLIELQNQFLYGFHFIVDKFHERSDALVHFVLGQGNGRDAQLVLFLVLGSWYCINIVSHMSVVFVVLLIYAAWKRLLPYCYPENLVLYGYVFVNVLVTFVFFAENLFLSKRYLIALSLVLMLWIPFALADLLKKKFNIAFVLALLFIFISSLGGIFDFGYSKAYLREAGDWLAVHVPADATLYCNDYQLMYYSKHFGNDIFNKWDKYSTMNITKEKWHDYDYIALRNTKQDNQQALQIAPSYVFKNKRGDQVSIYEVRRKA